MPLDPHVKRLLDMLAAAGPVGVAHATLRDRRQAFQNLMRFSETNVAIGRVEDRRLPATEGDIAVRIYTPVAADAEQLPGLVYFHGGGLVAGSVQTHDGVCRTLSNEACCRVVSVDYRLAPEHKFPAAIADANAATLWVLENASELGIDPDRIGVGGDSAGGTLAAVTCQTIRRRAGVKLAFQLLLCPILDFTTETKSRAAFFRGYLLEKEMMDRDLECYVPVGMDLGDPRVSPLRVADFSALPPAYIHAAEFDPLRDEAEAYANGLRSAGVAADYTCHPGMIHLFFGMASVIPYGRSAMKMIGRQMRTALQHCG